MVRAGTQGSLVNEQFDGVAPLRTLHEAIA
jgi:hypothetical protein